MHNLLLAILLLGLPDLSVAGEAQPDFAVGQQWSYETRRGEEASRLVILRIDDFPKIGKVIHVGISDAKLRLVAGQPPVAWMIGHMPFPEAAVKKSVTTLERARSELVFAEFEKSYARWKIEADAGKKQFWTMPVAEAIDGLETMIRKNRK